MSSLGYYRDMNEVTKAQVMTIISNKFYIHKSFDIQSDMEFLPNIPNVPNSAFGSKPNPVMEEW